MQLKDKKNELLEFLTDNLKQYEYPNNETIEINYPVNEYPEKIKSLSFDKMDEIAGRLWGISLQYLIFYFLTLINIRKHTGYRVVLEI